jgi:hypothetical protein
MELFPTLPGWWYLNLLLQARGGRSLTVLNVLQDDSGNVEAASTDCWQQQ